MFADIRTEWRVNEIERSLQQKADRHEISSISGDVDRLQCSLREARAETYELRAQLQEVQDHLQNITSIVEQIMHNVESVE